MHTEETEPRSAGTISHTRERLAWPNDRPFRILSIDGGGIKGIFPASFLSALESQYLNGDPIGRYFDLITGTSTGGIIALGLGSDLPAAHIADLYIERGNRIFPSDGPIRSLFRRGKQKVGAAYAPGPFEDELEKIFGDRTFGAATTRLCIPAFEGRYGEPLIYKTPHHPDYRNDQHELMRTIARSTAAAPTYLRAIERNGFTLVDGGLVANNPIMVGLIDALACNDLERGQARILSIGCSGESFQMSRAHRSGGQWQWRNAVAASMDASSQNALGQAYLLAGRERVTRIIPPTFAQPIDLADYRRARDELPPVSDDLIDVYGNAVAETFLQQRAQRATMPARQ